MSTPADSLSDVPGEARAAGPARLAATRPFFWSVRRELWDNRSIYMAPLIAAGVVLFGFLVGARRMSGEFHDVSARFHDAPQGGEALSIPFYVAIAVILATAVIVGVTYCLGALYAERRDRSILFWKSLPVSDLITVLSKATIPFVVLPLVALGVIAMLHVAMLLVGSLFMLLNGLSAAPLWTQVRWGKMYGTLAYALPALTLWYAPVWGWLLLVSGWARRAPFLWAVLPLLGLCLLERIAIGTSAFGHLLSHRLFGGYAEAFTVMSDGREIYDPQLAAFRFLVSPGLWVGVGAGAGLIAAAVWLRRTREPL